jgi:hypothetical protein
LLNEVGAQSFMEVKENDNDKGKSEEGPVGTA